MLELGISKLHCVVTDWEGRVGPGMPGTCGVCLHCTELTHVGFLYWLRQTLPGAAREPRSSLRVEKSAEKPCRGCHAAQCHLHLLSVCCPYSSLAGHRHHRVPVFAWSWPPFRATGCRLDLHAWWRSDVHL